MVVYPNYNSPQIAIFLSIGVRDQFGRLWPQSNVSDVRVYEFGDIKGNIYFHKLFD